MNRRLVRQRRRRLDGRANRARRVALLSEQNPLAPMQELKPKHLVGPCVGLMSSNGIHEGLRADFIRTFREQGETLRPVAESTFTSDGLMVTLTVLKRVMPETATTPDASRPPCLP